MAKPVPELRFGKGPRGIEDTISYALGHRTRIEILAALHEGPESADGLAKIVRRPLSTVTHHVEELLKSGSIEIARTERVGNLVQHFYSVAELPYYTDEEFMAMTPEERQTLCALILQASMTEALASLWAGKIRSDPRVMLAWNRINLDEQGREDLADEQARSWQRLEEIEAESVNRRAESGEPGVTYVITSFGYRRSRSCAPEPISSGDD